MDNYVVNTSTDSFDFIIVGAGSAGCVVASRLSEQPDCRVLLLEAGPPADNFWIRTPAGMAKMFKSERYNWRFHTEPVPTLGNRKLYWPRGKALGGSSAINGMVYCRGNRDDYDLWARLGNSGWSWDEVLPYFKRSENNMRGATPYHGGEGPLVVSDPVVKHPSITDFVEAARRTGIPQIDDFTGVEQEGTGILQANIRNGMRQSAYDAFIAPVRHRPNLVVRTGVHVRRVLFKDKEATGVEVLENGQVLAYQARQEVVMSAGALASPQLLMLSGIGDGEALQRHGIQTVMHTPGVGRNLQDHFTARLQALCTPESSYNADLNGWRKYMQGLRYILTKSGYLALSSSQAAAFVKSGPEIDFADLEISFRPMTFTYKDTGVVEVDNYHAIGASVYRVRPASRGEIQLRSADPLQAPAFIPNYLEAAEDVEAMLSGLRILRSILATDPMASRIVKELVPGPSVTTDEQLIDFMRREGHCAYHPAGSCKMGNDAMAVVDERLRVRGVRRLRVVDASIMPTVTSGNTNAPTIMIGEKGADMIRADTLKTSTFAA
ncbi:GMC family oxidoreductase [Pollutimonas nitritireducens]|uniref:GMC family oxidoreductase n=1 Tax=Pollutimonas nitritireducens TaxID=2045209 RepID=UPI001E632057|nr:GMC family oxidoreductase N-terminal domain-containing protein [Pollutimonas nitritireducens]